MARGCFTKEQVLRNWLYHVEKFERPNLSDKTIKWYQENCRFYLDEWERRQITEKVDETHSFIVSRFMRRT